jgi:transaldolase
MNNKIKLFIDGPTLDEINSFRNKVDGFTFNPSLFKKLGAEDYLDFTKKIIDLTDNKSVSIEVIGDDEDTCYKQALKINEISEIISVKIPIVYTNGKSTISLIKKLINEKIKLNITAIFTLEQIKEILPAIHKTETILSVFAGRIFDIGLDANKKFYEISNFIKENSDCLSLWASCRMSYDYINAQESGADIITMPPDLIKKIDFFGKDPIEYSTETVKMFYKDAKSSNFKI